MDPTDCVDFIANFQPNAAILSEGEFPTLEAGETIDTLLVTMSAEGAALGVKIAQGLVGEDGAAPSKVGVNLVSGVQVQTAGATAVKAWFYVDPTFRNNAAFSDAGIRVGVEFTITTSSSPSRRYQRTAILRITQK
jgi:hypothetical protein